MKMDCDYFLSSNHCVVTLGNADGGHALMQLQEFYAKEILLQQINWLGYVTINTLRHPIDTPLVPILAREAGQGLVNYLEGFLVH